MILFPLKFQKFRETPRKVEFSPIHSRKLLHLCWAFSSANEIPILLFRDSPRSWSLLQPLQDSPGNQEQQLFPSPGHEARDLLSPSPCYSMNKFPHSIRTRRWSIRVQTENNRIPRPPGDFLAISTATLFLDRRSSCPFEAYSANHFFSSWKDLFLRRQKTKRLWLQDSHPHEKPPKPLVMSADDSWSDDWIALAPYGLCTVLKFAARLAHLKPLD